MFSKKNFPRLVTELNGGCEHQCETCDTFIYHDQVWFDEDGPHKENCGDAALCPPCRDREARHLWHMPNITTPKPANHPILDKDSDDGETWCENLECHWCSAYFEEDYNKYKCECYHCYFLIRRKIYAA